MDCQTESSIEIERLKDKKRLVCEQCAKNLQTRSPNQAAEQVYSTEIEVFDFLSVAAPEPLSESEVSEFSEDEVLEIPPLPEIAPASNLDEVILTPGYHPDSPSSEESSNIVSLDDKPVLAEAPLAESPRQFFSTFVPVVEASQQVPDTSDLYERVEEPAGEQPAARKSVKIMTVKTSMLMAASVAFALFIAFGDKIIRPASKPDLQAENSSPIIAPRQDVKTPPPAASSAQPETAVSAQPEPPKPIPTQTPQVSETKPTDVVPSAPQPPAIAAAAEGQFTIQVGSHNNVGQANEQAEKLRAAGFEPRVVSVDIPKRGRWYRVQSGSFNNRDEANRYGSQVLAKGAAGTFVVSGL